MTRARSHGCAGTLGLMLFLAWPSVGSAQSPIEGAYDPFVSVAADETYGTRTVRVPAATYWVNTGVFLTESQTATITASGSWRVDQTGGTASYGPGGYTWRRNSQNGCRVGQLVARVGMEVDTRIFCIGPNGRVPARSSAGILYLAANPNTNDGGDWVDYRRNAVGELTARITSSGSPAPTILAEDAPGYDFSRVRSALMEIRGAHVILTVPTTLAQQDRNEIPDAVLTLDHFFEMHTVLHRSAPYHGQRIRFAASNNIGGLMVAGNPIRMMHTLVSPDDPNRITNFRDPWGFAHELGHDFTVIHGAYNYMTVDTFESWANVFTMHGHDRLDITPSLGCNPVRRDAYLADPNATYSDYFRYNPSRTAEENDRIHWLQLCLWMDLREEYGWELYENFFDELSVTDPALIPLPLASCAGDHECADKPVWTWIRDRLNAAATQFSPGADVTPILELYKVPLN